MKVAQAGFLESLEKLRQTAAEVLSIILDNFSEQGIRSVSQVHFGATTAFWGVSPIRVCLTKEWGNAK